MNIECTITEKQSCTINGIPEPILVRLLSLLQHVNDTDLNLLQDAINSGLMKHVSTYFDKAWEEIVFCEKCGAVGYHKNEDPIIHGKYKTQPCLTCNGEGSRVKKIFIKYEPIDENKRKRFASNDFKNRCTITK